MSYRVLALLHVSEDMDAFSLTVSLKCLLIDIVSSKRRRGAILCLSFTETTYLLNLHPIAVCYYSLVHKQYLLLKSHHTASGADPGQYYEGGGPDQQNQCQLKVFCGTFSWRKPGQVVTLQAIELRDNT